jgi:phospholipid-binding lipoprotein MlaA
MSRRIRVFGRLACGFVIALASADIACAASGSGRPPGDSRNSEFMDPANGADAQRAAAPARDPNDPYEEGNRRRFRAHLALHRNLIDPVERIYVGVVPELLRMGLHNILTNLDTPPVLANNLLKGRLRGAAETLSRFAINSTVGIGGIFDVASRAGLPYRDDDFGRTLAVYGASDSPYLMVPVIGPSNPRDLTGKFVDFFLSPLRYIALPGRFATSVGYVGVRELDNRSVDVGALVELDRTAPDPYAADRDMARARRNRELGIVRNPQ